MGLLDIGGGGGMGSRVIVIRDGVLQDFQLTDIIESFKNAEEIYLSVFSSVDKKNELIELEGSYENEKITLIGRGQESGLIYTIRQLDDNKMDLSISRAPSTLNAYDSIEKIDDFLYLVEYKDIDYTYADRYLDNGISIDGPSQCSAIRNGNFFGRNFDWFYNNDVDFVVKTPAINGRHASISVCGGTSSLNKDLVESGSYSVVYNYLPFFVLDGINDCGVFCNSNVVPKDKGDLVESLPTTSLITDRISCSILPRFVLDHYSTAREAVEDLSQHVIICGNKKLDDMGYCLHYMIGDATNNYIVEFIPDQDGNMRLIYKDYTGSKESCIMTNFYVNDAIFNNDGTVYTPATLDSEHLPTVVNNITPNGSGLERYNLIVDKYNTCSTQDGMISLLHQLDYRRAYPGSTDIYSYGEADPAWLTEFVGNRIAKDSEQLLTVDSAPEDFTYVLNVVKELYANRDRDVQTTWHTTHSCIYNIANKSLIIFSSSENGIANRFYLDINSLIPLAPEGGFVEDKEYKVVFSDGKLKYVEKT